MWKWLEQFFVISKGDKNAILMLAFLIPGFFIVPRLYIHFFPAAHYTDPTLQSDIQAFIKDYNESLKADSNQTEETIYDPFSNIESANKADWKNHKPALLIFDPNKIGEAEWIKLGFSPKQAKSIEKLKTSGFKFRKAEDMKKVYVISPEAYESLYPFIQIDTSLFIEEAKPREFYKEKPKTAYVIDINAADSSLFERQKGIGPSLASRIIRYRERLGGFISTEQIREVWGMPDSTYLFLKERFVVNDYPVRKLNINTSDMETMRKHPYVNYSLAKVIAAYRAQHGSFQTINDLKRVPIVNDSIFEKIRPYITSE